MSLPLSRGKLVRLPDLIMTGATDSNVIDADEFGKYNAITIFGPAALVGTATLQVGKDDTTGATFVTLQSPAGTDVAIAAGKAITIAPPCFPQMRVHSTASETVTFTVWGRLVSVTSP